MTLLSFLDLNYLEVRNFELSWKFWPQTLINLWIHYYWPNYSDFHCKCLSFRKVLPQLDYRCLIISYMYRHLEFMDGWCHKMLLISLYIQCIALNWRMSYGFILYSPDYSASELNQLNCFLRKAFVVEYNFKITHHFWHFIDLLLYVPNCDSDHSEWTLQSLY